LDGLVDHLLIVQNRPQLGNIGLALVPLLADPFKPFYQRRRLWVGLPPSSTVNAALFRKRRRAVKKPAVRPRVRTAQPHPGQRPPGRFRGSGAALGARTAVLERIGGSVAVAEQLQGTGSLVEARAATALVQENLSTAALVREVLGGTASVVHSAGVVQ